MLFAKEKIIFVSNVAIIILEEDNFGEVELHVQKMINAQ